MTENSGNSHKPTSPPPKKIPPIVTRPGGDQPGTRAIVNKRNSIKK
jgi:hypothetical protein